MAAGARTEVTGTSGGVVLVVDDDATTRQVFAAALRADGHHVLTAADGSSAIGMAADQPVDVVLLDQFMPGVGGAEVLRAFAAAGLTPTVPVILVTSDLTRDAPVHWLEAGAVDFLRKPVDLEELRARVRAQLRTRRAWHREVHTQLRQRIDVTDAICRTSPAASLADAARAVCPELLRVRGVVGAAILELRDRARVLAQCGTIAMPEDGDSITTDCAARLRTRSLNGPWLEPLDPAWQDGETRPLLLAGAPLLLGAVPFGVLLLCADAKALSPSLGAAGLAAAALDVAGTVGLALTAGAVPGLLDDDLSRANIGDIIDGEAFRSVFQPIVDIHTGAAVGFEALTRFDDGLPPELRFVEADRVAMGTALEVATMRRALVDSADLPDGGWLSLNVSPHLLARSDVLGGLLEKIDRRVVLEVTEHHPIDDYQAVVDAVARLPRPVELSIDDTGAGFASLRHVLALKPRYVKLDRTWIRGINDDPARSALVAGLQHFAERSGCQLIAEGVEDAHEQEALQALRVELAQGFFFGRPSSASASASTRS